MLWYIAYFSIGGLIGHYTNYEEWPVVMLLWHPFLLNNIITWTHKRYHKPECFRSK